MSRPLCEESRWLWQTKLSIIFATDYKKGANGNAKQKSVTSEFEGVRVMIF
jgi:hypothetical protein